MKDIYKALIAIGRQQVADAVARDNAVRALDAVAGMFKLGNASGEGAVVAHYEALLQALNAATLQRHLTRDFSAVFERYIHDGAPPVMPPAAPVTA